MLPHIPYAAIISANVAMGTLLWTILKDRKKSKLDYLGKTLKGFDNLVDDLLAEREAMQREVRALREERDVPDTPVEDLRAEVLRLRVALTQHDIQPPEHMDKT